ncbi:MAG: monofunctional biosynthetic peptidoglycan transglycosylase [Bacteroidales bacterium]|nr:monofunctional biosynthetic peptidoglycan transglycosylase [Bacteroidales bacterium]
MKRGKRYKTLKAKSKKNGRGLCPWRELRFFGRVWRVVWIALLAVLLLSWLQVLLGIFVNPPLTPLMAQRFFQQLADDERPVRFERDYVRLDDISPNLITAVVYAEDGWFMYHHGFDVKQMKIAYRDHRQGRRTRGASTISQQTAKNAFLPHSRNVLRKAAEAYYTLLIETVWSKRRIMEVYLNIIEFGDGIYGCEAASQHYFGHSASKLSRDEAAQLAATLPSPLKRNPAHQSPYFRRQAATIKSRFVWGKVNINMSKEERRRKAPEQENLIQFIVWTFKQK